MNGLVHSIETFSTSDGPGIRTVVFLQGCLLRCLYCQNPDTWPVKSETAKEYSAQELFAVISRNKPFFLASGGGLTFSGGEPMLQPDFVKSVFKRCRQEKIHTAFESSLFCRIQHIEQVLPYTDLVLADIKSTGQPDCSRLIAAKPKNHTNINNLDRINTLGISIWLRYVILPGWTDKQSALKYLSNLARKLDQVKKIELLPYHALGRHKWSYMGMDYPLEGLPSPERSILEKIAQEMQQECSKEVIVR